MTTPASSDSGRGQENDTEPAASADAGSGQDAAFANSLLTVARDAGAGADAQTALISVFVPSAADAGIGSEGWSTSGPMAISSDTGTGAESVGSFGAVASDAGSGQDVVGPLGIWPFPPAWLFPLPGGSFVLIWRPGTPDEMLVRSFPVLDQNTMRYAQIIRDADDVQMPTDSDVGAGSEASLPTATIVQYALGALVTCGVPS